MPSSPAIQKMCFEYIYSPENAVTSTYLWKLCVILSNARLLNGFFEFVITDSAILKSKSRTNWVDFVLDEIFVNAYLIEIGQIWNFIPEASHYVLKFGQFSWIAIAFTFDNWRKWTIWKCAITWKIIRTALYLRWCMLARPCTRNRFDPKSHCCQYLRTRMNDK